MYKLVPTGKKKIWNLCKVENGIVNTDSPVREFNLLPSSLTNDFKIVANFLDELNLNFLGFSDWFENLFDEYIKSGLNYEVLYNNKEIFLDYAKKYIKSKNIDYSSFVNLKKTTNTSIIFDEKDLEEISISSACLKLYGIFSCDGGKIEKGKNGVNVNGLRPPENQHKEIFRFFVDNCLKRGITNKIFQLMRSRTFKSYLMDRYLWDLCEIKTGRTPDLHIMVIFNRLMNQLFSILDPNVNPIPFLNNVIDGSISWLMKTAHNNKIIYGEAFSGTEDIYGGSALHNKYSLFVYTCNDVLSKSTSIGMNILNEKKMSQFEMDILQDRIDNIDIIYPYMKLVNLPIISNVLEIPYKHLLTIPPKHAMLSSVFMYSLAKNTGFYEKYPFITDLLIGYPKTNDVRLRKVRLSDSSDDLYDGDDNIIISSTKSSYRLRNLENILNDDSLLFGFNCRLLRYRIMSSICGVLSVSKKNLIYIDSGKIMQKIKSNILESEVTKFFNNLYSGKIDDDFKYMRDMADSEYF